MVQVILNIKRKCSAISKLHFETLYATFTDELCSLSLSRYTILMIWKYLRMIFTAKFSKVSAASTAPYQCGVMERINHKAEKLKISN